MSKVFTGGDNLIPRAETLRVEIITLEFKGNIIIVMKWNVLDTLDTAFSNWSWLYFDGPHWFLRFQWPPSETQKYVYLIR